MLRSLRTLDRVLKGELTRPEALQGGTIDLKIGGIALLTLVLGAVYGVCMGVFALTARWSTDTRLQGYQQMLASGVKVPLLFLLTLVICFPSLYVFNALVGSKLSVVSIARLMVAGLATIMAVLASFGTITVFFSLCTTSYSFMVLLNVLMFVVAVLLGLRFLLQTLHRLSIVMPFGGTFASTAGSPAMPLVEAPPPPFSAPHDPAGRPSDPSLYPLPPVGALDRVGADPISRHVKSVFQIWMVVFCLVGAQMGWVLRPFIGSPYTPFTFFRERSGNVFQGVVQKLEDLSSESGAGTSSRRWSR